MRIAITANGEDLDAPVAGELMACSHFVIYDTEEDAIVEVEDNPGPEIPEHGGALEAAEALIGLDPEALLTGEIDPDAGDRIAAAGVEVYVCTDGTVRSAVERFKTGDLELRPGSPNRGFYPGPGSAATPHTRESSPAPPFGRETIDTEIVGHELECVCPSCGWTTPKGPGGQACELPPCPRCGASMESRMKLD